MLDNNGGQVGWFRKRPHYHTRKLSLPKRKKGKENKVCQSMTLLVN
jgi:hypothetical protein